LRFVFGFYLNFVRLLRHRLLHTLVLVAVEVVLIGLHRLKPIVLNCGVVEAPPPPPPPPPSGGALGADPPPKAFNALAVAAMLALSYLI
jgi:hypothetical protein